eukprot:TRINITY_DN27984_c0_g3_i1.p2 TRINITY_DN27984_c0_g3~~TRINITY_DN27984_c0_g3_i1.p2  ORF type:complete len:245 (-),score=46.50 TRINITY_DN27984_c0_g3_i1:897-1601(-)
MQRAKRSLFDETEEDLLAAQEELMQEVCRPAARVTRIGNFKTYEEDRKQNEQEEQQQSTNESTTDNSNQQQVIGEVFENEIDPQQIQPPKVKTEPFPIAVHRSKFQHDLGMPDLLKKQQSEKKQNSEEGTIQHDPERSVEDQFDDEQIQQMQKELEQRLSPDKLQFLRKRGRQKLQNQQKSDSQQQSKKVSKQDKEEEEDQMVKVQVVCCTLIGLPNITIKSLFLFQLVKLRRE